MDRTVYLHVGHGRCGSSSIQTFADVQREALAGRGVFYPSPLDMGFSREAARAGNGRALVVSEDTDAAVALYTEHIGATEAPRVLLSAEQFTTAEGGALEGLVTALREEGMRVVGIFYLREQREWLVSRWAQGLKSHRWTVPLDDYVATHIAEGFEVPHLDYRPRCARLAEIFGAENLVLRRFTKVALRGGDVRLDLFELLGTDVSDLAADEPTANASASIDEVVAMRILNGLPRGPMFNPRPFLRYAENYAGLQGWTRERQLYRLVRPERMRAIAEHYAPINEDLRVSAFPADTPSPLFPSSVPDEYEPLSEDEVVTTRSMTLVASFLTWYAERVLKRATATDTAG
ncbi:hypothetical protein [Capillimicrobium parvum]|uniref:Uncharacterized protein n=1 Tax=Capillimicrobium parvum TaxID=2884022 RepID=A0A9E6XVA0_9ACTN|nr:hypothetical protein [Capillimicrobium parvum]UGS35132.1 hypothetical protein DSM104329_01517 [Capillimicrobium parvum]